MDVVFQDPGRDRRERERQRLFRDSSSRKPRHGITARSTLALRCGHGRRDVAVLDPDPRRGLGWLLVIPIALFGNWIEWAAHRYILHRPVKGLEMIYKRHCTVIISSSPITT